MEADKKIEAYLERAKVIHNGYEDRWTGDSLKRVIEIAKMIQLEEHREQK